MIFINKMDKEWADFDKMLSEFCLEWGFNIVVLQIFIGKEESFKGIVDLFSMKVYIYKMDSEICEVEVMDILVDLVDGVVEVCEVFIEVVVLVDDELFEKYFEEGEFS